VLARVVKGQRQLEHKLTGTLLLPTEDTASVLKHFTVTVALPSYTCPHVKHNYFSVTIGSALPT